MELTQPIGSGESGKSTIVKQMKIIHQNGYTQEERQLYRLTIYKNLIDCMKALIGAMHQFELEPDDGNVKDFLAYIEEYNVDPWNRKPLRQWKLSGMIPSHLRRWSDRASSI